MHARTFATLSIVAALALGFGCGDDEESTPSSSAQSSSAQSSSAQSSSGTGGMGMGGAGTGGPGGGSSQGGTGAPGPQCPNCGQLLSEPACDAANLDADSAGFFDALKQCGCDAASCGPPCAMTLCMNASPEMACATCLSQKCGPEYKACHDDL